MRALISLILLSATCFSQKCVPGEAIDQNRPFGDMAQFPQLSLVDCGKKCCATDGCLAIAWGKTDSKCWLKSAVTPLDGDTGFQSMVMKFAPTPPPTPAPKYACHQDQGGKWGCVSNAQGPFVSTDDCQKNGCPQYDCNSHAFK